MLGPGRFTLWQSGKLKWADIPAVTDNGAYGKIIGLRRLREQKEADNRLNSGGIVGTLPKGALNPDSYDDKEREKADRHAKMYYEAIRNRTSDSDVKNIAKNTGYKEENIRLIKQHIFLNEHNMGDGVIKRFDADYNMAQSWFRLIEGKDIQEHDILLLKHEFVELKYMSKSPDITYDEAHKVAQRRFNYRNASDEYNKRKDK